MGNLQRNNSERQEQLARSIRKTCFVSIIQAVIILATSLPLRWYQISDRLFSLCDTPNCYKGFSVCYKTAARMLVFLGPIFNPWLYSIQLANVRNFLSAKTKRVISSVDQGSEALISMKYASRKKTQQNSTSSVLTV